MSMIPADIIAAAEAVHLKILGRGTTFTVEAIAKAILAEREHSQWHGISGAPKGARGTSWMLLAYGPEGDQSVSVGLRFHDKFYAAGTFYVGGRFDERQFALKEHEVTPTHWMPLPAAPKAEG